MQDTGQRHDVIMAGIGGKGVLIAGQILARAALAEYKYVSWTPTYYTLMLGGASECTVIMTNNHPGAPVLPRARKVVVFEASQLKPFEGRVQPGGVLIAESAGMPEVERRDVRVLRVPAIDIAGGLGGQLRAAGSLPGDKQGAGARGGGRRAAKAVRQQRQGARPEQEGPS